MGHLINPVGYRLGVFGNWKDSWISTNMVVYSELLHNIPTLKKIGWMFLREETEIGENFQKSSIIYSHLNMEQKFVDQLRLKVYFYDCENERFFIFVRNMCDRLYFLHDKLVKKFTLALYHLNYKYRVVSVRFRRQLMTTRLLSCGFFEYIVLRNLVVLFLWGVVKDKKIQNHPTLKLQLQLGVQSLLEYYWRRNLFLNRPVDFIEFFLGIFFQIEFLREGNSLHMLRASMLYQLRKDSHLRFNWKADKKLETFLLLKWFSFSRLTIIQTYLKGDDWFKDNFFDYYKTFLNKSNKLKETKQMQARDIIFKKFSKIWEKVARASQYKELVSKAHRELYVARIRKEKLARRSEKSRAALELKEKRKIDENLRWSVRSRILVGSLFVGSKPVYLTINHTKTLNRTFRKVKMAGYGFTYWSSTINLFQKTIKKNLYPAISKEKLSYISTHPLTLIPRDALSTFAIAEEQILSDKAYEEILNWLVNKYDLTSTDYMNFFKKSYNKDIKSKWKDLFQEPEASEDQGYRSKNYLSNSMLENKFLNLERFSLLVYTYLKESYKVWELRTIVLDDLNRMRSLKDYNLSYQSRFKPYSRKWSSFYVWTVSAFLNFYKGFFLRAVYFESFQVLKVLMERELNQVSLLPIEVEFFNFDNDRVSAPFLAYFLSRKFEQNFTIKDVLNPVGAELLRLKLETPFLLGFKVQFIGRITRRARLMRSWRMSGSVPTAKAEARVEYAHEFGRLRNGVCSIKVWLYRPKYYGDSRWEYNVSLVA